MVVITITYTIDTVHKILNFHFDLRTFLFSFGVLQYRMLTNAYAIVVANIIQRMYFIFKKGFIGNSCPLNRPRTVRYQVYFAVFHNFGTNFKFFMSLIYQF